MCPAEGDWPETGSLTNAVISCSAGFFGERTRFCDVTGTWGPVVETACRRGVRDM